jgi:hypothetical protein
MYPGRKKTEKTPERGHLLLLSLEGKGRRIDQSLPPI